MLSTFETLTPRPTCDVPPEPLIVLDRRSEKTVREPLKPRVLVFARLLPITVIAAELVLSPLTPLYSALDIPIIYSSM